MRDAPGTLRLDPRWVSAVTEEAPAPRGRRAEPWSGSELVVWRVSRRLGTPPQQLARLQELWGPGGEAGE